MPDDQDRTVNVRVTGPVDEVARVDRIICDALQAAGLTSPTLPGNSSPGPRRHLRAVPDPRPKERKS